MLPISSVTVRLAAGSPRRTARAPGEASGRRSPRDEVRRLDDERVRSAAPKTTANVYSL